MLRRVASIVRDRESARPTAEAFAKAIDALDEERWQSAIEQFGPKLEGIDPRLDTEIAPIGPADLIAVDPDRSPIHV